MQIGNLHILNAANLSWNSDDVFVSKKVNIKYSQIIAVMSQYPDDENLIDLSEHVLNIKCLEKICLLDDLLNIMEFYIVNKKINKFALNFICVNAMEILRMGVTRRIFEEKIIFIFGFICENSNVQAHPMAAIYEFFEEFKSKLFHGRFIDSVNDFSDITGSTYYNANISDEAFDTIKTFYKNLSNKIYVDEGFLNYLNNYLHLSNCLTNLQI